MVYLPIQLPGENKFELADPRGRRHGQRSDEARQNPGFRRAVRTPYLELGNRFRRIADGVPFDHCHAARADEFRRTRKALDSRNGDLESALVRKLRGEQIKSAVIRQARERFSPSIE